MHPGSIWYQKKEKKEKRGKEKRVSWRHRSRGKERGKRGAAKRDTLKYPSVWGGEGGGGLRTAVFGKKGEKKALRACAEWESKRRKRTAVYFSTFYEKKKKGKRLASSQGSLTSYFDPEEEKGKEKTGGHIEPTSGKKETVARALNN